MYSNQQQSGYFPQQGAGRGPQQQPQIVMNNGTPMYYVNGQFMPIPPQQLAQMGYQNQTQQPAYGQQPAYVPQQPAYSQQQPAFNNRPMNQFGTMNQPPQVGENTNANSRYGSNVGMTVAEQYKEPEVATESVSISKPEPKAIPLLGNEYPFLVAPGLTLEKQMLGGFFKYLIKGSIMGNDEISLAVMAVSEDDVVLSQDRMCGDYNKSSSITNLKIRAIEEGVDNYASEVVNLTEYIVGSDMDSLWYNKFINKSESFGDLAATLNTIILNTTEPHTSKFLNDIDQMLTGKVNDVFKFALASEISIDSFASDMGALLEHVENNLGDAEISTKYKRMLDILYSSIKVDVEDTDGIVDDINYETGNIVKVISIPSKVTICNVTTPTIVLPLDSVEDNQILAVNETSHPVLYKLIDRLFKETNFSKGTVLTLTTESGTYYVRSSTLGYATVVKA